MFVVLDAEGEEGVSWALGDLARNAIYQELAATPLVTVCSQPITKGDLIAVGKIQRRGRRRLSPNSAPQRKPTLTRGVYSFSVPFLSPGKNAQKQRSNLLNA